MYFRSLILITVLLTGGCVDPKGQQPKPHQVSLEVYAMDKYGRSFTANSTLHAPIDLFLAATVEPTEKVKAKDIMWVHFFANAKKLDTRIGYWHERMGYGFLWTNVPAGNYVLTAKAYDFHGFSAVSSPVTKTIRP
jgi:hypothetical protein